MIKTVRPLILRLQAGGITGLMEYRKKRIWHTICMRTQKVNKKIQRRKEYRYRRSIDIARLLNHSCKSNNWRPPVGSRDINSKSIWNKRNSNKKIRGNKILGKPLQNTLHVTIEALGNTGILKQILNILKDTTRSVCYRSVLLAVCGRVYTRVGTLIVATIYLQLIQNRYMFRSFTFLQCSHQHCVQPVASDVEVVGYL